MRNSRAARHGAEESERQRRKRRIRSFAVDPIDYSAGDGWVTTTCSTGKLSFINRACARRAARNLHDSRLSAYLCTECRHFHFGHLPEAVVRGELPRQQLHSNHRQRAA